MAGALSHAIARSQLLRWRHVWAAAPNHMLPPLLLARSGVSRSCQKAAPQNLSNLLDHALQARAAIGVLACYSVLRRATETCAAAGALAFVQRHRGDKPMHACERMHGSKTAAGSSAAQQG